MATSEIGKNKGLDIDWRARLQVMRANKDEFFGELEEDALMHPLKVDRGIVFQYQPSMFIAYAATYDTQVFQGSNYPLHTYMSSTPPTIPIQVQYSCTNQEEARYLLAMMQFLKVSTKSQFGEMAVMNNKVGRPPPVLEFSYLGPHGYDRVPVVINDVNYIMVNNVDYIPVSHSAVESKYHVSAFASENEQGGSATVTYVPTDIDMTITCLPQYSPRRIRRAFNLDDMRKGKNIGFI